MNRRFFSFTVGLSLSFYCWTVMAQGTVKGPPSSTPNALARFTDSTGKEIKNSPITLSDTGILNLSTSQTSATGIVFNEYRPIVTHTTPNQYLYGGWFDPRLRGTTDQVYLRGLRIDGTNESTAGTLWNLTGAYINPMTVEGGAQVTVLRAIHSVPDVESPTTNTYGLHHEPYFWRPGGTFENHFGVNLANPTVDAGDLQNNYGLYVAPHTAGSLVNYNIYSAGATSKNLLEGPIISKAVTPPALLPGQFTFTLDEAGNRILFTVKYADGTLKTGQVSLQ